MRRTTTPALIYVSLIDRTLDSGERCRRVALLMITGASCLLLALIGLAGVLLVLFLTVGASSTLAITGVTAVSVQGLVKTFRSRGHRP